MSFIYVLQVIFGISLLIFVHELGHFLLAKKCGVRVETFAIGFGPRIFGWRRNKDGEMRFSIGAIGPREPGTEDHTDYRFALVPLGGYVKMAGEEPDEELTGAEWEFPSKTIGQRAAIIVAGVVFNAIFAFLAFIAAFQVGVKFTYPEVGFVNPGGSAWEAGLDRGDRVLEINGSKIEDFDGLATKVAFNTPDKASVFKIKRGDRVLTREVYPRYNPQFGFQTIGIGVKSSLAIQNIMRVGKEELSPAEVAGMKPDDEILGVAPFEIESKVQLLNLLRGFSSRSLKFKGKEEKELSINLGMMEKGLPEDLKVEGLQFQGQTFENWWEFQRFISLSGGHLIPLEIMRDGEKKVLKLTPAPAPVWLLGIENGSPLVIEGIRQGTLAAKYFKEGDEILSSSGQALETYSELFDTLKKTEGDLEFQVKREDETVTVEIPRAALYSHWLKNGVYWSKEKSNQIEWVRTNSLARRFFRQGDIVQAVSGTKVTSTEEIIEALGSQKGDFFVTVKREEKVFPSPKIEISELRTRWVRFGMEFRDRPIVGQVQPGYPAKANGIKAGDELLSINEIPIKSWSHMSSVIQSSRGKQLSIKVKRGDKTLTVKLHPQRRGVKVESVSPDSPLKILKGKDQILAVNKEPVHAPYPLRQKLMALTGKEVTFTVLRDGEKKELKVQGNWKKGQLESLAFLKLEPQQRAKIGVRPRTARYKRQVTSLSQSIWLGCKQSYVMIKRILLTLKKVLTAQVSAKNLGGPVLIAQASYSLAKLGLGTLLYFLGLLSLNLAVINLLPIPILDGGHLVFLTIEKIKGSKVSEETMMIANYIGLAILLFLMIFVTYNDIMRLLR